MFGRHYKKRSTFLPFVIFRLLLSLIVFAILMGGLYSAFQSFSGVDPLKIDPKAVFAMGLKLVRNPEQTFSNLSKLDLNSLFSQTQPGNVIPADNPVSVSQSDQPLNKPVSFSFLLVADSHNENNYLQKALEQGKGRAKNLQFVIGLGDYTEVGTLAELQSAKKVFDAAGLRYFLAVGDHDLWDARDKGSISPEVNFNKVFGQSYQSFVFKNVKFILMDNADIYLGMSQDQLDWVSLNLKKARVDENAKLIFGFIHAPLYHPSSDHTMGNTEPKLKDQAKLLINMLKNEGTDELFAGDIHFFTRYQEPETKLNMTTLGAVASAKNTQAPRYSIVTVYEDGSYSVEDVEIK